MARSLHHRSSTRATATAKRAEVEGKARRHEAIFGLCVLLVLLSIMAPLSNDQKTPGLRQHLHAIKNIANERVKLSGFSSPPVANTEPPPDFDAFHNASLFRIKELVNDSSVLVWRTGGAFMQFYKMWHDMGTLDHKHHDARWNDTTQDLLMAYDLYLGSEAYHKFKADHNPQGKPHVLLTRFYENWGALSQDVPNRTWGVEGRYEKTYQYSDQVKEYLEDDNLKAVFVTQHQSLNHPKVHSIPLGTKAGGEVIKILQETTKPVNKTQLLMVNFNTGGNPYRTRMEPQLLARFNGTVQNTYGSGQEAFLREAQRSKFVLCPSGVGWDSYRVWEALYMGAFPVVETLNRTDGYYRIFQDLPVLLVEDMERDVTPELLEKAYLRMASDRRYYKYEKLTKGYWKNLIDSFRPSKQQQAKEEELV